jgi:hypothetical protein
MKATRADEKLYKLIENSNNAPVFYKPKEVLWLHTWLNRAAVAVVVVTIVSGVAGFPAIYNSLLPFNQFDTTFNLGMTVLALILTIVGVLFQSAIGYFGLKALGSILRILLEMEFNARGSE